jgi:transcriptional regulator with XRE-family HTH domain
VSTPIPKRIKEARIAKDVSQRRLGLLIGFEQTVASARMNQYEQGKRVPDFQTLEKMAEQLGVPVAYFFCMSDNMAELVKAFGAMSEAEQTELLEAIRLKNTAGKT